MQYLGFQTTSKAGRQEISSFRNRNLVVKDEIPISKIAQDEIALLSLEQIPSKLTSVVINGMVNCG